MDSSEGASDKHTLLEEGLPFRWRRFRPSSSWCWRFLGAVCFISILVNLAALRQNYHQRLDRTPITLPNNRTSWVAMSHQRIEKFEKPKDFRIVGLIFAGRRDRLAILDCYLQRNLVQNGGFLDEVIFLQRTAIAEDISFLQTIVSQTPGYTLVNNHETQWGDYSHSWDICESGTMYIKIDDDIVYIEDSTIPAIVRSKLDHPNALFVSANAMNQAGLSWIHQHMGVVRPYLPELKPISRPDPKPKHDWRASLLPEWEGPEDYEVPVGHFKPPFASHRWLPARHLKNTDKTPIVTTKYATGTTGVTSWAVGAQQHYSFLEHLENGELWRYQFPMWDYNYMRLSITFIAIWGDDIVAHKKDIPRDDEGYLTVTLPQKLERHVIVDGTGLAVHFAFHTQKDMESTDLLDRYKAYADENICVR